MYVITVGFTATVARCVVVVGYAFEVESGWGWEGEAAVTTLRAHYSSVLVVSALFHT